MMEATNLLGKSDPNGTMTIKGKLDHVCKKTVGAILHIWSY